MAYASQIRQLDIPLVAGLVAVSIDGHREGVWRLMTPVAAPRPNAAL